MSNAQIFQPPAPIDPASPPPVPGNSSAAMSEIVPGLYLGNLECAQRYEWLANQGITHVLSLTSERVKIPVWTGIIHKQFRVRDNRRQNLLAQLIDGIQFLEEAFTGVLPTRSRGDKNAPDSLPPRKERPVRVYVHCRMGISRSGSVVIGYLMKYHSRPYNDALNFVRTRRIIVCPNKAFVAQLELLESCAFDVAHLGPELLNPNIDNPYDPYAELDNERSRTTRKVQRSRDAIPAWERDPVAWCETAFKTEKDAQKFKECVKIACNHSPMFHNSNDAEDWQETGRNAQSLARLVKGFQHHTPPPWNRQHERFKRKGVGMRQNEKFY